MPRSGPLELTALLAGMRRIFLRDFAVSCSIGIHAEERAAPQRVLVNVDLYVEAGPAALGDDIGKVVDYDFLREGINRLAASGHFNLQESLAHAIGDLCLAQRGVLAARISTEKPDIYPECDAVGVEIMVATDRFRRLIAGQ